MCSSRDPHRPIHVRRHRQLQRRPDRQHRHQRAEFRHPQPAHELGPTFATGRAFRGGGQGFRLEAQPGTVLQRYLISFTEPYFLGSDVSSDVSAFYYNRIYFDWTEARVGGRLALGRR